MRPRLAVVVPTYKRDDLLDRCITALIRQDLPADDFEIIVADNAGSSNTRNMVERRNCENGPRLRYISANAVRGPAAARNAGWRSTAAPVIAFTDDDCVPQPCWARAGLAAIARGADAAAGRVVMPLPAVPTDYERDAAGLTASEFVTADLFCRRDVLKSVGGFDERFTDAWREDSDLHFTLIERGFRIVRASHAVVEHPIRPAPWGISLSQQKKTRFDVLLFKKHPSLYRRCVHRFPTDYYAIGGLLVVLGLSAFAGTASVGAAAAFAWGGLTGRFCARRLKGTSRKLSHLSEMVVTSFLIPPLSLYWRLRGLAMYRALFL